MTHFDPTNHPYCPEPGIMPPVGITAQLAQASVTYPAVTNIRNRHIQRLINTQIRRRACQTINTFGSNNITSATSSYDTMVNKNNVLSLMFENYYYPEMAAHGMTIRKAITLNLITGYEFRFRALFNPLTDWKSRINEIIQAQIIARDIPLLRPFTGVTDDEEYYLTEHSLFIFYQIYDYTPYAYGILIFEIPYVQILDILNPRGPIPQIAR